jgi:MoaA/NifB/PqqE/SkfB family radical SAM enzyme
MKNHFMALKRKIWGKYADYLYKKQSLHAVPTQLGLCVTHLCNIQCPYCMRETFKPPMGTLTLPKIKNLLKKMPYINGVCIMGLCEPFLNRETPDIIRWLKDEGKYSLSFTTNCTIDLDENKLDGLLRVDDVALSIDTADPETFRILRGGANLDRCMRNVKRIRFQI